MSRRPETGPATLTYVGHATVLLEMGGVRLLTDPVLRDRAAHLRRLAPAPDPEWLRPPDAVLLSHLHLDHCDLPSLRLLGNDVRLIVPRGAGAMLSRRGFVEVEELAVGDTTAVGPLQVTATPALHNGFRPPFGPTTEALGFVIGGNLRIYFAGDTDLFPEMADLGGDLDVALLPVWGWGRRLGPGHLDPERAAKALRLLRPRLAIPIHWGSLRAARLAPSARVAPDEPDFMVEPPHLFARHAAELAPDVEVRILPPGSGLTLNKGL